MTWHILRLIWNRRKSNAIIMIEIFLSFLVLFALGSMTYYSVGNYLTPLGFTYDNVVVLRMNCNQFDYDPREMFLQIGREIRSFTEVVQVSMASSNLPYSRNSWGTSLFSDNREFQNDVFYVDDDFATTMGLAVVEGRWFGPEDNGARLKPIVINRKLREAMFGSQPALGKIVTEDQYDPNRGGDIAKKIDEYTVVGVIDNYRYHGEFASPDNGFFRRNILTDSSSNEMVGALIKVRSGAGVAFEEKLMKRLQAMAPGWTFRIGPLKDARATYLRDELLVIVVFFVVAGFLIFNVALGLYGVLRDWLALCGWSGCAPDFRANSGRIADDGDAGNRPGCIFRDSGTYCRACRVSRHWNICVGHFLSDCFHLSYCHRVRIVPEPSGGPNSAGGGAPR